MTTTPKRNPEPEDRLQQKINRAEGVARSIALSNTQFPPPCHPGHFHKCLECCKPGHGRGAGLIKTKMQYYRADGVMMASGTTVMICPGCNGYGFVLTQAGADYAKEIQRHNLGRRAAA